ncbi:uncharacterized protein (DUF2336 family) [Rhizomicrobium palustre]|uniref:Uncharacterized protein (DUF2336 family) n=1 Tax=Rhizomicrobium palustre TaxID=189966 RepID=A0A846N2A6_9PROT|nr:uncharacterized protein (DUF2336 family) [Rhizomicrobium palustre]
MGLTARDMSDMGRLAQLASNPQDTTREELYLAVASLYRVQGSHLSERERLLMRDILLRLTHDVEMAIRISLAERLADDPTAPNDLVLLLADDTIEVARPVILRSPLLCDEDMLHLIAECGVAHQEAVAARPHIGETVTAALSHCEAETVLVTLVRNATAKISGSTYEVLVEKSQHIEALQEPITHRKDLPPVLATKMCGWVSETLKTYIQHHYEVDNAVLSKAVGEAETAVRTEPAAPRLTPSESAQKLVDKLYAAGQLKAGFLLRVLHQGQIDLFDLAFARLLNLPLNAFRQHLYERGPRYVALACRAVGIDRCVFSTVFRLSRQARMMKPVLSDADLAAVEEAFAGYSKAEALLVLKEAALTA